MKKLNLHQVEGKLLSLNLKIFRPQDLTFIFGASKRAVQGFLNYNTKKGVFVRLKKGLYSLKRNFPQEFFLANQLYSPSYVSLESALSYYHLIPETVYAVTSITTKPTREFEVNKCLFDYRKIKKQAYIGYIPCKIEGEIVYLATPEKAVADFLYFVSLGKKNFNDRLRLERIDRKRLNQYLKVFASKRLISFAHQIFEKND